MVSRKIMDNGSPGKATTGKDFLLAVAKRQSASPLPLSLFTSSVSRSAENIPLMPHSETAFTDSNPGHSHFLTTHTNRFRTSSLTSDVSSHMSKGVDSGNSSLIDSSSTDSDPDFGGVNRSRTASSSKSDQNLIRGFQNDFPERGRHSSVYDGSSCCSEKLSLNTGEVMEASDECLPSSSEHLLLDGPTPFSLDTDNRLPPRATLTSDPAESCQLNYDSCDSSHLIDSCEEFPDVSLNLTVVRKDMTANSTDSLNSTLRKVGKNGQCRSSVSCSGSEGEEENSPLLNANLRPETTGRKTVSPVVSHSPELRPCLRRTASLGSFVGIPVGNEINHRSPTKKSSFSAAAHTPEVAPYPKSWATTSGGSIDSKGGTELSPCKIKSTSSQSRDSCRSFSTALPPVHPSMFSRPVQLLAGVPSISSPNHPRDDNGHVIASSHNPSALPMYSPCHVCSHDACTCQPSPLSPQLTSLEAGGLHVLNAGQPASSPGVFKWDNSCPKTAAPDLQSVLGFGKPFSSSELKRCTLSEEKQPLQVFVPRVREMNEGTIQGNVEKNAYFVDGHTVHLASPARENTPSYQSSSLTHLPESRQHLHMSTTPDMLPYAMSAYPVSHHGKAISQFDPQMTLINQTPHLSYGLAEFQQPVYCASGGLNLQYPSLYSLQPLDPATHPIYVTGNPDLALMRQHCNVAYLTPNPKSVTLLTSGQFHSEDTPSPRDGCDSEPGYRCAINKTRGEKPVPRQALIGTSKSGSTCTSERLVRSRDTPESNYRYLIGCPEEEPVPSASPVSADLTRDQSKPELQRPPPNQISQQFCFLGRVKRNQQQMVNGDPVRVDTQPDINPDSEDDHGYRAGMTLRVPRSCFEPDFLHSQDNLTTSRRESLRQSSPSSLDSVHVDNQASLQRSNTSQLGLLKGPPEAMGYRDFLHREIPDYRLFCFLATIFNPLFGIVAFVCNRYARRSYRCQRYARANNLYFATITSSTVGIFLTLVGVALLIARTMVFKALVEEPPDMSTSDCYNKLYGHDESLMNFFNMNYDLYCRMIKNEKIMNALTHYWLLDTQTRKYKDRHKSVNNDTGSYALTGGLDDNLGNETIGNNTKDGQTASRGTPILQGSQDMKSHNTVVGSNNGPEIPPGLEKEYEQFLTGKDEIMAQKAIVSSEGTPVSNMSTTSDRTTSSTAAPSVQDVKERRPLIQPPQDDVYVPPGLEEEYEKYKKGETRAKANAEQEALIQAAEEEEESPATNLTSAKPPKPHAR